MMRRLMRSRFVRWQTQCISIGQAFAMILIVNGFTILGFAALMR